MMKLTTYDKYKDSGVEWLGEVPEYWEFRRFKDVVNLLIDGTHYTPEYTDNGVHFLSVNDITRAKFDLSASKFISTDAHQKLMKRCKPEKGDVLLSKNGTIGVPFIIDFDTEVSIYVSLCLIKLKKTMYNRFFYYMLLSDFMFEQYRVNSKMTSVSNLHLDKLKKFYCLLPLESEQIQIANYLDQATTKIDKKIDLLTQKIKHYQDLKTALINRAVTKGLDDSVEMKDSSVEWIGEIPKHWEVVRMTDYAAHNKTKNIGMVSQNLLSLSYGNIKKKNINTAMGLLPESFETYQIVKKGYIILRLTDLQNDKKSLRVGFVKEDEGIITSAYLGLVFNKEYHSNYAYYLLHNYDLIKVFYWQGGSIRQSMKYSHFKDIPFLKPPRTEQQKIVEYLNQKTSTIDKIITTITTQIEHQKELRKTLINDVVTGKVKVENS